MQWSICEREMPGEKTSSHGIFSDSNGCISDQIRPDNRLVKAPEQNKLSSFLMYFSSKNINVDRRSMPLFTHYINNWDNFLRAVSAEYGAQAIVIFHAISQIFSHARKTIFEPYEGIPSTFPNKKTKVMPGHNCM